MKQCQRTRGIAIWHDHGTLLGLGVVMITAHILYDPAVFFTQAEIHSKQLTHAQTNLQATIENPLIHMFVACSSGVDDQASIVQDRIDCLMELADPLETSQGITIRDKLLFFVGDHPAKQFERGTQSGGTYKCGGCGVKDVMMDDLAHTLQLPRRNLHILQQVATAGKWGIIPGKIKPFDALRVQQLRDELSARGIGYTDQRKAVLESMLKEILQVSVTTYPTKYPTTK